MAPHIQIPRNLDMFDPMSHGPKYARVHPLHVKQQTGGWTAHHSFICSHLDREKPKFVAQSLKSSSILHTTLSKLKSQMPPQTKFQKGPVNAGTSALFKPPYWHLQQASTEGLSNRKSVPRISFATHQSVPRINKARRKCCSTLQSQLEAIDCGHHATFFNSYVDLHLILVF